MKAWKGILRAVAVAGLTLGAASAQHNLAAEVRAAASARPTDRAAGGAAEDDDVVLTVVADDDDIPLAGLHLRRFWLPTRLRFS